MKIKILYHSTTGNTRLVARYAEAHLVAEGHRVDLVDIVKQPEVPSFRGVDLVGVACPTMNFRHTFTLERYILRMPNARAKRLPAFLLGTCAGMPGAHYVLLAEQLACKGYVALGAHWVLAPSNWPAHVSVMRKLAWTERFSHLASRAPRSWRPLWASIWESWSCPDDQDRQGLVTFLDRVVGQARAGDLAGAPTPRQLAVPVAGTHIVGRIVPRDMPDVALKLHIESDKCSACGTCMKLCPEGVIVQKDQASAPQVTRGCSGCYSCFNHCPEGAIGDALITAGDGQYKRVPAAMKTLFSVPRQDSLSEEQTPAPALG
jgi:Pyruvate/2-oxoacid:ferredoxin oxidoreductase delta subunit/flavodoxin